MAYSFYGTTDCSDAPRPIEDVPYNQNWEIKDLVSIKVNRALKPDEHLDFSKPGNVDQLCGDFQGVYGEGKTGGQLTPDQCATLPWQVDCYRLWREGSKASGDVPN